MSSVSFNAIYLVSSISCARCSLSVSSHTISFLLSLYFLLHVTNDLLYTTSYLLIINYHMGADSVWLVFVLFIIRSKQTNSREIKSDDFEFFLNKRFLLHSRPTETEQKKSILLRGFHHYRRNIITVAVDVRVRIGFYPVLVTMGIPYRFSRQ